MSILLRKTELLSRNQTMLWLMLLTDIKQFQFPKANQGTQMRRGTSVIQCSQEKNFLIRISVVLAIMQINSGQEMCCSKHLIDLNQSVNTLLFLGN